jgi:hypothetical protein
MKSHHLKILYMGRSSAVRMELARLLQRAGYVLTTERQTTPRGGSGSPGKSKGQPPIVIQDGRPSGARGARRGAKTRTSGGGGEGAGAGRPRAMNLRSLRESVGRTQDDIARKMSISQSQLSRVEGRRDHLISTLRRYVRGLGGEIEVCGVFDGARIVLEDV